MEPFLQVIAPATKDQRRSQNLHHISRTRIILVLGWLKHRDRISFVKIYFQKLIHNLYLLSIYCCKIKIDHLLSKYCCRYRGGGNEVTPVRKSAPLPPGRLPPPLSNDFVVHHSFYPIPPTNSPPRLNNAMEIEKICKQQTTFQFFFAASLEGAVYLLWIPTSPRESQTILYEIFLHNPNKVFS